MSSSLVIADPSTSKAHLLGLPTELRLQIYDLLIASDINYNTGAIIKDGEWSWSWKTLKPQNPLRIAVGSLAMSCSLLAVEVRTHIRSLPAADRVAAVVYDLEPLHLMSKEPASGGPCYFERAPCQVEDLTSLKVTVNVNVGAQSPKRPFDQVPQGRYVCLTAGEIVGAQLEELFHPTGLLGHAAALTEVHVFVHISRGQENKQSGDDYVRLVKGVNHRIVYILCSAGISSRMVDRTVHIKETSFDVSGLV